jgi:hypothetical protein
MPGRSPQKLARIVDSVVGDVGEHERCRLIAHVGEHTISHWIWHKDQLARIAQRTRLFGLTERLLLTVMHPHGPAAAACRSSPGLCRLGALTALLGTIPVASAATFTLFGSVGGPRRPIISRRSRRFSP